MVDPSVMKVLHQGQIPFCFDLNIGRECVYAVSIISVFPGSALCIVLLLLMPKSLDDRLWL
jgi:hypothetical protein